MIRAILFDLDDTLYPRQAGIMEQIRILMLEFIQARFDLSLDEANALRRRYFQEYGTTMRGLQVNHAIDADEFLDYVHNIRLEEHIKEVGVYSVPVHFHSEIQAKLRVWVVEERSAEEGGGAAKVEITDTEPGEDDEK